MALTQLRGAQILDETITEDDLNASVAGVGISGGAGSPLALAFSELTDVTIDVAADSVTILDATDSSSKRETVADLISAVAGNGLGAAAGVLSVNVDGSTIEINADTVRVKAAGITNNELALGSVDVDNLSDLRVTAGTGALAVDVAAGTIRDDNTVVSVSATDELAVADDATNFIEVDSAGSVTANAVGFTTGRIPLATVVTATGAITSINDKRAWLLIDADATGLTNSNFVDNETPTGDLDGVDTTYTLANAPSPSTSLHLYLNGQRLREGAGNDFTLSGSTITFANAPVSTDVILADYRK